MANSFTQRYLSLSGKRKEDENKNKASNTKTEKANTEPQKNSYTQQYIASRKEKTAVGSEKRTAGVTPASSNRTQITTSTPRTSYIERARNATEANIATGNTMSQAERETQRKAIQEQLSELRTQKTTLASYINGARRGNASKLVSKYSAQMAEVDNQISELEKQLKEVEMPEYISRADQLKMQEEEQKAAARAAQSAVSQYSGSAGGRALAQLMQSDPEGAKEMFALAAETQAALDETQQEQAWIDYLNKYSDKEYEDNFRGQFNANFRMGAIGEKTNKAFGQYLADPSQSNYDYAMALQELEQSLGANNADALDDEGAKLKWITQSAAGYLPQLWNNVKAEAIGGGVGALAGFALGNPKIGYNVGATVASGAESYGKMRGAAYRNLIAAGIDEETARAAANDEALISTLIEMAGTAASLAATGTGKAFDAIGAAALKSNSTNAAVKFIGKLFSKNTAANMAKSAAKEAGKTGVRKAVEFVGRLGLNAAGEYVEEGMQEGVSIANEKRVQESLQPALAEAFRTGKYDPSLEKEMETGFFDLMKDAYDTLAGAVTGEDKESRTRIHEAGVEGFKIALMFGGTRTATNTAIQHIASAKTRAQQTALIDSIRSDKENLEALIQEGKDSGEGSVAAKIATQVEQKVQKGEAVTAEDVKSLIAANSVYIAEEERQAQQTEAEQEQASRDGMVETASNLTGYGKKGSEMFVDLVETNGMTIPEARKAMQVAYEMGFTNKLGYAANQLTGIQKEAYNAGKLDAEADLAQRKAKNPTIHNEAGFDMTNAPADITSEDKAFAQLMAKGFAVKGVWGESTESEAFDGKLDGDGIVTLAKDFGISVEKLREIGGAAHLNKLANLAKERNKSLTALLAEEITVHRMMELAPEAGTAFINAFYNVKSENRPAAAGTLAEAQRAEYGAQGVRISTGLAIEEVAGHSIVDLYGGEKRYREAMERILTGTDEQAKTGARTFVQLLKDTVEKLKKLLRRLTGKANEEARKDVREAISENERLIQLFEDAQRAAIKAAQDAKKAPQTRSEDGVKSKANIKENAASNKNPTENANIHFSLKAPVEETKDLLALHNMTEKNLRGVLRLGGFPMPSLAVVKAEAGHSKYGPISVVFGKDTIDPRASSSNKVYGGDAYTPTDPGVYYPMDRNMERDFDRMVWEASQQFAGGEFKRSSPLGSLGYNGESRDDLDEIARRLSSQEAVQAAYLSEQGKTLEPVMRETISDMDSFGNDALQAYINRIGESALVDKFYDHIESNGTVTYPVDLDENEVQTIREVLKEKWRESPRFKALDPATADKVMNVRAQKVDEWRAAKFAMNAWNFYVGGGYNAEEVDRSATKEAMQKMIAPSGNREEVEAIVRNWAKTKLEGLLGEPGVFNGKSAFTPSGARRKFWSRHDPYTLENIVKAMKANQQERGGQTFGISAGSLQATAAPSYKSVAEIKADSARLGAVSGEEYESRVQAVEDQINHVIEAVKEGNKSSGYWERDTIGGILKEAAEGKKTVDAIMRKFKAEGYNISTTTAKDIQELFKAAAELPTEYFEAKPQRPVGFDEVLAVVVPEDLDAKLIEQMEQAGMNVLTYKTGDEADRLAKVNSVDDAKFSLKGQSDLMKENAKLREVNEALREQFKVTKLAKVDAKKLESFTRELLRDYNSGADRSEVRTALDNLYSYMANGEEGNTPAWNEVQKRAYEVATDILSDASIVNDEMYQSYKGLRDYLRNTGLKLDKRDEHDLGGYENLNEFRKANFGRIKITNDGVPVTTAYQELASMYPEFFDEYEHTHPADQLLHIEEVLLSLEPFEENPYRRNMRESATWLANDIIERFYELPQAQPTFADKAEQKLTKQKIADAKKLERVRDQKNERVAKLIAQQREKVNRVQTKERQKKAEAVKKVKEHYTEKEARMSDRRKVSAFRNKINKHVANISKMLLNPTETSHVPEVMRSSVSEFLAALDLTTERQGEKTVNRLNALKNQYQKIADGKLDVEMEVDPDLIDNIEEVITALGNDGEISIEDLNSRQLEALYRVTLAVERSIYSYNRAMNENMKETIAELGHAAMIENSASKGYQESTNRPKQWAADVLNMDMLNPQDFFMQSGDTMERLFNEIRKGFDTKIRNTAVAQDYMKELTKGVDMEKLTGKKAKAQEFTTGNGQTISLTPAQVMSLYLLNRQKDAQDHIYVGGIKQAPTVALKGKGKRPQITRSYDVVHVMPEDVGKIISSMTEEQKRIAEGISKFFTDYTAEWGNEVSLKLYGYKKFTVENYFPIVSDRNYIDDVFGETTDMTLKNMGSTKSRQKGANNPVIIEDVFDVFTRQADQMSSYNAFVIPLGDMQRVFNFKTMDGSVKQSIEKRFGVRATRYFKQLMTDINGGARYNGGSELANKLISNYKQAKLGLNLRVVLQQPTAILRAQAVIDGKYLAQAIRTKSSADMETIYKYAPIAQWKNWGYFSMDTGKAMKDLIMDEKTLSDYTMWAAGKMDELTWKRLWVAAELEIRDKKPDLKVGSEEYLETVGQRFSEIIDRTQVVDSVLHRSQIMRNPDGLVKMSVSFMNEPFKAYNMLRSAAVNAKNNPGEATAKALRMAVVGYVSSVVVNHLITAAIDTLRGDEDDEEWLEKIVKKVLGKDDEDIEPKTWWQRYLWHFVDNLVNEPLSMWPYLKDVVSLVQGYDIKRMDMQGIGDLINAATRAASDKYTIGMKIVDVGAKAADLFGIPASSLKREIETVSKLVLGAVDSPWVDYQLSKLFNSIKSSKNKKLYLDILYRAYEQGDKDEYKRIVSDMIAEGFPKEDPTEAREEIDKAMEDRHISAGVIELGYKNTKSYYDEMFKKVEADDISGYNKMFEALLKVGVKASTIQSAMRSRATEAEMSVSDIDRALLAAGIEPEYDIESDEPNTFTINNLSTSQAVKYNEDYSRMVTDIVEEFERRGFGDLDEETANGLLAAAYDYASTTALLNVAGAEVITQTEVDENGDEVKKTYISVNGELYKNNAAGWVLKAQKADEIGLTLADYLILKEEYGASSIGAKATYDAYEAGVEVENWLEYNDATKNMDGTLGKLKKLDFAESMNLSDEEYNELLAYAMFDADKYSKNLAADQYDDFAIGYANVLDAAVEAVGDISDYDEKVQKSIYGYADTFASEYVLGNTVKGYNESEWVADAVSALSAGVDLGTIFEAKYVYSVTEGIPGANGKTISGSKKKAFYNTMRAKGLTSAQLDAIWKVVS